MLEYILFSFTWDCNWEYLAPVNEFSLTAITVRWKAVGEKVEISWKNNRCEISGFVLQLGV